MQHVVKFIEKQIFLQITGKNFLISFKVEFTKKNWGHPDSGVEKAVLLLLVLLGF